MNISPSHQKRINAAQSNFLEQVDTVVRFSESSQTKNDEYELKAELLNEFIKKLTQLHTETLLKIQTRVKGATNWNL